jgi:hypothetical protein
MLLNEQKQRLIRELARMGAIVVSPPGDNRLRFQAAESRCESILGQLSEWGWQPVCCGSAPQFHGMEPVTRYQLDLQEEEQRQPVVDNRTIRGELATDEKPSRECVAMLVACLGKKWELK